MTAQPPRARHGRPRLPLALLIGMAAAAAPLAQQTSGAPTPVVLTGTLADGAARPLAYYPVQACLATTCYFAETSADGRFRFDLRLPVRTRLAIKTPEAPDSTPRRAAALAPLRIDGAPRIDTGTVHVPDLPSRAVTLTGRQQIADAGDGLSLVVQADALEPPAGRVLTGLAARRLAPAQIPRYDLPAGERVHAVYVFHPFGTIGRSPVGVRVESDLATGTRVRFRTINELDGSFSEPVGGSATGTHLVTNPGTGISTLTHLVVTR